MEAGTSANIGGTKNEPHSIEAAYTVTDAELRTQIEETGNQILLKYCNKRPNEPTMLPPIPNYSRYIDKYPEDERVLSTENLEDKLRQQNYEAEVKVYRALERLDKNLIVLHGLTYTCRQYAILKQDYQHEEGKVNRVTGECDFVVLFEGTVLIIEVSDVRQDETTSNKKIRRAFNQKKKQGERTEVLVREMIKLFGESVGNAPLVRWLVAFPNLPRNIVQYNDDEMSRIIFSENLSIEYETLPDYDTSSTFGINKSDSFLSWWKKNVTETTEFSVDKMHYLSKTLIGLWCMDSKNDCDIEQKCSLGCNILVTDKALRDAEITYGFGRKSKQYENPNMVVADEIFQKMGIHYLSKKQNEVFVSQEKFLWINGPAGSGKTVLILGNAIQTVQDSPTKAVIFMNINEDKSKEVYQNTLRNSGIQYKVLNWTMNIGTSTDGVSMDIKDIAEAQAEMICSYFNKSVQVVILGMGNKPSSPMYHVWRELGGLKLIREIIHASDTQRNWGTKFFIDDEQCLLEDEKFDRTKEVSELQDITEEREGCAIWICSDIAQWTRFSLESSNDMIANNSPQKFHYFPGQDLIDLYSTNQHPVITLEENFRNTLEISNIMSVIRDKMLWSESEQISGHFIYGPKPRIHLFPDLSDSDKVSEKLKEEANKIMEYGPMNSTDVALICNNIESGEEISRKSGLNKNMRVIDLFDTFSVEWPAVICLLDVSSNTRELNFLPQVYLAVSRGRVFFSLFIYSTTAVKMPSIIPDFLRDATSHAKITCWRNNEPQVVGSQSRLPHQDQELEETPATKIIEASVLEYEIVDKTSNSKECQGEGTNSAAVNEKEETRTAAECSGLAQSEDMTDVYLSHDWGKDEQGQNNHDRASAVNDALKQLGYKTWFDSDKMTGDIVDTLCDGIDKTRIFLVFVTQRYAKEVQSGHDNNTQKLEFKYAKRNVGAKNMIPVIMEERMKRPGDWRGPVGMTLGGIVPVRMFFDFGDSDKFRRGISDLKKEIDKRLE